MPVFRLTPRSGTEASPQWHASSMRPHCLWIRARDEYEARKEVARATRVAPLPGEPESLPPCKNVDLVACEYDDSKDVATGIIYVRRFPDAIRDSQQRRLSA